MRIEAPESTTNSRSSGLFEATGADITFDFTRKHFFFFKKKRGFVRILELVKVFRQFPRCSAGASFLGARSPHVIFPRISARQDYAYLAMGPSSRIFIQCQVPLENLTACFDPNIPGSR